jgi:ABC-type sugar transport system permease subunit
MAVTDRVDLASVSEARPDRRPSRLFRNLAAKIAAIPMVLIALVIFVGCTLWTVVYSFTKSGMLPKALFEWETVATVPGLASTSRSRTGSSGRALRASTSTTGSGRRPSGGPR